MNLQEQIKKVLRETVNQSKGWGNSKQKLEKTFKFKDFNDSIDFVNKVSKIAESQNHHPDIEIKYNKVKISITDHEKGGVSEKCHKLVKGIDGIGNEELTESKLISLVKRILNESDPKVGTGKKPKDSDRRLYTDENPNDTVSVKFRTKQDIVDTLNKESFKSKSHARQSQIINLIHQRLRVALERAKDPEVKKRLRTAFEYIETKKEASKRKTKEMKEGVNLNEDEDRLNQILDKINTKGMNSLNNREKTFLYSLNKTDTPQETKTYDYKITVISNKNYSFEMIKKFIERLLKNNGIESEVSYNFMGLGMGFSYEIRLNNYFLYKNEIRDFLTKNGFKIIEEGPINNNTKISQDVVNKIQRHTKNYDVLISPNHGHKITSSQEIERIGKILNRNNIRNYSMSGDNGSIELTLTSATKEEKDKIYIILSNSGYDVTQNQKGKYLKETIRRHTML
jgi:4a-hydroxytetrahydrobiopterin dehydratase